MKVIRQSLRRKHLPESVLPRQFCRDWFGIAELDPQILQSIEFERGYRKKCVKILATVLGLTERAIEGYGSGLDFSKMPTQYHGTLGYAILAAKYLARQNFNNR